MKTALLVMTYGSPSDYTFEGIADFFTNIRDGVRPRDEEINELLDKYRIIGSSPLQEISRSTVNKLKDEFNGEFEIYFANKFSNPRISETISQMEIDGIEKCICLILEPYYSMYSVMGYEKFINSKKIKFNFINEWNLADGLISYWSDEICRKIRMLETNDYTVVFTAHSVPEIAKEFDDPYLSQVGATVDAIVERMNIEDLKYTLAWQSESKNGMEWIKPDVLEYLKDFGIAGRNYIFAPIGFISDHIETYYDIDYECKEICNNLNLNYNRITMPNDDVRLIKALVDTVLKNKDKEYKIIDSGELEKSLRPEIECNENSNVNELKMPYFVKKLIEKKGRENVKMPEHIRKMLIKAGKIKE